MNDKQELHVSSQVLPSTDNISEVDQTDIAYKNTFPVEQNKITVSKTPKKGVHKKSPSKSQKRTPKKNLLKIKASFTTPKKRRLSEDTASEDIKSKRLKNQDDNTEDNDEEGWQDVHDGDESEKLNVDVALEQKAIKVKMNAKNVKSVIHHVLTNEHVLNMFKSVLESGDSPEKKDETPNKCFTADKLDCVPKLTRAKVKDLLEKVCVPSPVKPGREGPSILDVEFAEEEDDDEYNPEKDDECHESDDDESIVSSQLSEFGSPYPTTPSTPIIRHNAEEALTTTPVHSIQTMNLNLGTPRNLVTDFNQTFDAMAEEDKDGVDTIALRTRSKLPLTSTSITDIENAFVAPDITPDMYDNTYEDADWAQFLSSLCKPSDETITDDDADANDPEFNYIAEAEREKPDEEDFRFDKPTQITKKELTSLINELNDMFEDELLPYQVVASVPDMNVQFPQQIKPINDCQIQGSSSSASALFNDFKTPQPQNNINTAPVGTYQNEFGYEMNQSFVEQNNQQECNVQEIYEKGNENIESFFTSEQLAQTQDNLRKHIQLLIQSSLLFQDREIQTETTSTPQNMLLELETMRNESPLGLNSVYNVCNLDPALELLKDNSLLSTEKTSPDKVSVVQWKPGLEQFQYCRNVNPVELIHRYLIRGKNANQIHFRIQFMSSPKVGDNPIKSVKKTGKLPEDFPKPVIDEYFPMAPKDQVSDLLPKWCLLTATKPSGSLIVKADNSKSKRKSITPRLAPDARLLNKNKIQALPTLILPNAMAAVSGIYIQFGQPSNSNTPNLPSPFAVNNQNYFTVSNLDSSLCSSPFSVKSTHSSSSSSSQTEENYKLSKNKTEENTLTEETSAHNMSLSSPDVLAKTMISCGIQESPLSSSSSMSEPVSSSTLCHQASSKHPIVRNLSSAFDAAHGVREKSHKSSRSHHNPKSSKARVVVDQIKCQEINKSVNEMGRATTLKADTGNLCVLSDSVSDHEMNLVIEESDILSSQENTITAHSGKITSSELVKPIRKTVSQNLSTTTQDSLLNIPDVNTNPRDINKSDFLSLMDSCSEENSKEKSEKSSDFQADRNSACLNSVISNLNKTLLKDTEAKTPTKLRHLVPKPATPSSTYTPLPKLSPRRKELNKQVRQIIPKTFVFEAKSPSPTKAAALMLKKKATLVCQQRSPVKILPKSPQPVESSSSRSRVILTPSRMYTRSQHLKTKNTASDALIQKRNQEEARQDKIKSREIIHNEMNGLEEPNLSQEEEEEEEAFVEDDQIQLEDLMAASTTIKYDPKKGSCGDSDTKTKSQRKKDIRLAMLDPDIIECDPKKDERDTAYAQFYFSRVKEVLKDDLERFRKFLTLLHDQNKDHCNPIELYADLATLLSDHQDLVDDFAGFLLSFQAVECQCFVSSFEYQQIRTFLRQLEIYCDSSTLNFQRTLKMMSKWLTLNQDAQSDSSSFKDRLASVLRHVPGLMDDLFSYFFDSPVLDSHPDDFETVTLDEVYDVGEIDKFEEVTLPDGREDYNTKLCSCKCHDDSLDDKLHKRSRHCISCSLKMFEGKPVLKMCRNEYHDVSIIYPLEEKEKLAKAKKEAALIALAKARAQRQQKRKNKKKIKNVKTTDTKKKKKVKKKTSYRAETISSGRKTSMITSDNKNLEACAELNSRSLEESEMKENENCLEQQVSDSEEKSLNNCEKAPAQIPLINNMSDVSVIATVTSNPSSLFLPSATSSPITNKSFVPSGTPHARSFSESIAHVNLNSVLPSGVGDSQVMTPVQPSSRDLPDIYPVHEQQNSAQKLEKIKQPSVRAKSKPRQSQSKKSSNPDILAQSLSLTSPSVSTSLLQPIFPNPPHIHSNPLLNFSNATPLTVPTTSQTRIPVVVILQPQDSLPETTKTGNVPTQVSSKKSRTNKSEAGKTSSRRSSNKIHAQKVKPLDKSQTIEQNSPVPTLSTNEINSNISSSVSVPMNNFLSKSQSMSGMELSEAPHVRTNSDQIIQEQSHHKEPPVPAEDILGACSSSAHNKTSMSTIDFHTSDTSSLFHFSPSKFKGKIPDVVRAYLDNFSLGGFDETMDIHVQLAQAISPCKPGAASSKFNILAYLDASLLASKDGASMSIGKSASESESRLSFSGALSDVAPSKKCLDSLTSNVVRSPHQSLNPEKSLINVEPSQTSVFVKDYHAVIESAVSEHNKEKEDVETQSHKAVINIMETDDIEEWSEEWDRFILNIVAVDGITSSSLKQIHQLIPEKSLTEIDSRAKLLLQMLQTVGDSESDAGISCDDSSNM
ncbi:hypothetical protein Btru_027522 [Bulinus truncatus]|nr:hypothetical protein Btru_027522 [Bulinus truncatus]